jgi:anti-sigma regulatory factor (Ser/Thr protein kinase)
MSASPLQPQPISASRSFELHGGDAAPGRARDHVLSHLDPDATNVYPSDAVLVVSELVTNSVLHADIDNDQMLSLELTTLDDHVRIAVIDPGSPLLPRLLPLDSGRPGGLGLRLVDQLSSAWGVERDPDGTTRVWCDLPLNQTQTV